MAKEICNGKLVLERKTDQELLEIEEAFLDYLENLKVRNDRCMEELRIKQFQLNNYKNKI